MEEEKFISAKYKLKQSAFDAFPDKVARPENIAWWIDREEELQKWEALINKAAKTRRNYMAFIIGNYGRGKTFSLLKIVEIAKNYERAVPVFLNLKGEEKSTPGLDLLFKIFRSINFFEIAKDIDPKKLRETIDSLPESLKEVKAILRAIYFGTIGAYQTGLFGDVSHTRQSTLADVALNFLKGDIRPNATQLKQLSVLRKIDKIDIAKEYLAGILVFIRKLGYTTLLLAVDEFEGLFSLVTKSQQSIYIALLRSLYDFPMGTPLKDEEIANMVFFFGISESGWASLKEMESKEEAIGGPTVPLMERIDEASTLSVFNKAQARELIEKRLKYNRIEEKFEVEPLIPFTENFVEYVQEITNGEPRDILEVCGHVLDAGIAERVPKLDRKFAESVLEARGY